MNKMRVVGLAVATGVAVLLLGVGTAGAQEAPLTVASDDTSVTVAVIDGRPAVTSLICKPGGFDWVGGPVGAMPIPLIDSAEVGGTQTPLSWRPLEDVEAGAAGIRVLKFVCDRPALELHSIWEAHRGPGPVEHRMVIYNRGTRAVLLPVQSSLELTMNIPRQSKLEQWWVDKGAGTPTPDGTHHREIAPGERSLLRCWPSGRDQPRDPIPWTAVENAAGRRGWYAGIEYTARVEMDIGADEAKEASETRALNVRLGLERDEQVPFFTRLLPGESFEVPPAFIGCYEGDVDDGANRLRRWVRANLTPRTSDPRYPLLVNNSWGGGMAVDERLARKMIDESAELGLEMFHIDAGWFRTVGDWRPDPRKFPNGLAPVADYCHRKGLKFGMWVGWTQGGDKADPVGAHRILSVNDTTMTPWFSLSFPANWKAGDFTGATVCLAEPHAADWCLNMLRPIIKDARLDMLEHDQTMVVDGCSHDEHRHTRSRVDVGYRAAQGYYRVYDTLRAENPDLLFENCVNGGHMVDYGAVRRCHYISITDTYDPLSNRRAFYDASYALPSAMCECYVANVAVHSLAQFKYMLRSGMMGWCTIMTDTSKWSREQHQVAIREFAMYKRQLRPLIQTADLYHISARPDGVRWDGIEYFDPPSGKGVLFAFRGTTNQQEHTFTLKGLEAAGTYALSFEDNSSSPIILRGDELMNRGLRLTLSEPQSSQIVHVARQ